MAVETFSIIFIMGAMSYVYLRASRKNYAVAVLPLLLVPLANLASITVVEIAVKDIDILAYTQSAIVLIALVISTVLLTTLSHAISSRTSRRIYLIFGHAFNIVLTFIYVNNFSS